MFGKKSESKSHGRIDSLIGAGTRLEGDLRFSGGLRIDGEVIGSVSAVDGASSSMLVVSEHARIQGAVAVAHLIVNGTVVGPICVAEMLEMQPKARVVGDVEYASIEMHQGAVIEGRLVHGAGESKELNPISQD